MDFHPYARLAQLFDENDLPRLADRIERVAMRPFREDMDVKDPEAYARLQELTGDPRPIRHLNPGEVPLVVTKHTGFNEAPNAGGWAKTVHLPHTLGDDDLADLIYRTVRGKTPGKMMSSKSPWGGTPVHEQAHVDLGNRYMSIWDTMGHLGIERNNPNPEMWGVSAGEIAAQIVQIVKVAIRAGVDPEEPTMLAAPQRLGKSDERYLAMKSGVRDRTIIDAVTKAAWNNGWQRIIDSVELVLSGRQPKMPPEGSPAEAFDSFTRRMNEWNAAGEFLDDLIGRIQNDRVAQGYFNDIEDPRTLMNITPDVNQKGMELGVKYIERTRQEAQTKLEKAQNDMEAERSRFSSLPARGQSELAVLAVKQAAGRQIEKAWEEFNENEERMQNNGWASRNGLTYGKMRLMDRLFGIYSYAANMGVALDTPRMTEIVEQTVQRGGFKALPGEDLESDPERVEAAKRYAATPEGELMPQRYENALVAQKLGLPLPLLQSMLFCNTYAEEHGIENAVGRIQATIILDAPDDDSIVSVMPFIVGEPGRQEVEHWVSKNSDVVERWRNSIETQPAIEGSMHDHQRVLAEWDRLMGER